MVPVILRPYFFAATAVLWQQYAMDGIRRREREADRPRPGEWTHVQFALSPAVTVRSIHHLRTHWRPPRGREGGKESSATLVEARPLLFGQPIDRGLCHAWTVTAGGKGQPTLTSFARLLRTNQIFYPLHSWG